MTDNINRRVAENDVNNLPVYESKATLEQKQQKLEWMAKQLYLIKSQEKLGTPHLSIKIRCSCNKLVKWMYMYRCLYCGIWYCKECAEEHYGTRVPTLKTVEGDDEH